MIKLKDKKRMSRGKSETVLETLKVLNESIPPVEKALFTSLVEDNKKLEERMTAIEKEVRSINGRVATVETKVDTVISDNQLIKSQIMNNQASLDQLNKLIQMSIDQHKNRLKIISGVLRNKWFWVALIIFMVLVAGASITDLAGIIKIENNS